MASALEVAKGLLACAEAAFAVYGNAHYAVALATAQSRYDAEVAAATARVMEAA